MAQPVLYKTNLPAKVKAYEGATWLLRYGGYAEGDKLPSERVLSDRMGVSRTALRTLVDSLVETAAIETRHGSGTYVMPKRPLKMLNASCEYAASVEGVGMVPGTRVISLARVAADGEAAARLEVEEGDEVWKLVRVRTADGEPCLAELAYFSCERFPDLDKHIDDYDSLCRLMREVYGVEFVYGYETVNIEKADPYGAALLGIQEGKTCYRELIVDRDSDNVPVEYSKHLVRPDRYQFANCETLAGFEGELDLSWLAT